MKKRVSTNVAAPKGTGNRIILGRCLAVVGLLVVALSSLLSLTSKAPVTTANGTGANADNKALALPDVAYYKYPFQNPALAPQARVDDLIARMTLDEKVSLLHQFSGAIIRLGVPQFRTGTEGLHGLSWLGPATVFPQGVGLSMTWDKNLITQVGNVVGEEARAYNSVDARFNGVDIWAPVIDLARDPRSGRISENMGEDALLAGLLSTNYAFGMKGGDPFYYESIPTLKHFAAYGQEANRTSVSVNASPRNLYEYYLKAFQYGIQSGAATGTMTSYNLINGKPTMTMPEMLSVMFGQWVPGGLASGAFFNVTDAGSPSNLSGSNAYYPASTLGQAASMADSIKNGVSAMTPGDTDTPTTRRWIYEALARGMLTEGNIDSVIHGMLLVRLHAGDLDADPINNPYKELNKQNALNTPANKAIAKQAAQEQVVLLKNVGGILPLPKTLNNVALVGPLGDESATDFYAGTFPYATYIKQEVQGKLIGGASVLSFTRGINIVALQVVSGTGTPAGKFLSVGATAGASLTGTGTSSSDPNTQFYHYDYGYDNMLLRSVTFDQEGPGCACYVAARGSGNTLVANSLAPGYLNNNRASQQFSLDENFGFVGQVGNIVGLNFVKGTGLPNPAGNPNVFVSTTSPFNVQHNGNAASTNRQFSIVTVKDGIAEAVTKATGAQVAIVAVGDQPQMTSRETQDRQTNQYGILLSAYQENLINSVAAVNPNTIVVIVGSYPFDVRNIQANPNVKGIVYTSHAGQELGTAVADVLFGDYAPAGRLNQTWYPGLDTIPTISDYDIIKGQRTYQYYTGTVIYPFGYGLSYTNFNYANVAVSPNSVSNATDPNMTVSLTVQNTGTVASDEVVQLYAKYNDGATSKVLHPLKTLEGFDRIHLNVGETKPVTFTVRLSELAIWDVSRDIYFVEPGSYTFMVGRSAADSDILGSANITVTGSAIPPRNLNVTTLANNFDDYSFTTATASGLQADLIPISAMEDNTYSLQARKAGGWVKYANVTVSPVQQGISMRASNSNASPANVEVWMNGPSAGAGGVQLGTVAVPATGNIQTFVNVGAILAGFTGSTADIYLVFPTANISVKWFKFGPVVAAASSDIQITSNTFNGTAATSLSRFHVKVPAIVYQKSGSLIVEAMINGSGIVTGAVTWSVTDVSGNPTTLATINSSGQLTAAGTADGFVRAVATYNTSAGPISNFLTVELKNQTVTANTNAEALIIRSGFDSRPADISWGPNQFTNFGSIYKDKGTLLLSAVTYPFVTPARTVVFTLTDSLGNPTNLATIVSSAAGFVEGQTSGANNAAYNVTIQATGLGNGDVYVKGTTTNGLTYTSKVIIQNQGTRNAFTDRYEAELFDNSGNTGGGGANLRADDVHGDDVGLQLNRIRNNDYAVYNNVDLGSAQHVDMTLKYVKVSSEPATIKVMVDSPITGTVLGSLNVAGDYNIVTGDYANVVYNWKEATIRLNNVPGVHNLYFVFSVSANVPNTDISSTYGAVAGWLDLGINWFKLQAADAYAHFTPTTPISVSVGSTFTIDLLVNSASQPVRAQQSYLTFPTSQLQNVVRGTAGTLTDTVEPDLTSLETVLQNQVCNGPSPCTWGAVTAPAGSLAFASGTLGTNLPTGDFRVARVTFKATTTGDAIVHWQFSPPDPANRNSSITDANNNVISNQALYQDFVIHVVSPTITGHVTWEGRPAQPNILQSLPISLTLSGPSVYTFPGLTTDANGNFSVNPAAITPGTYTWRVKGPQYLSTTGSVTISSNPSIFIEMGLQPVGDANNDNLVDILDFGIVSRAFGHASPDPLFDARGDFNGDLVVDIIDFALLHGNFGRLGNRPVQMPEAPTAQTGNATLELKPQGNAPANGGTVHVGDSFTLELWVNAKPGTNVVGQQSYLSFPSDKLLLGMQSQVTPGSSVLGNVTQDKQTLDIALQNAICNGSTNCKFGGLEVAAGTVSFASGTLAQTGGTGSFRIGTVTVKATSVGVAQLKWQFSPPNPSNRNTSVVGTTGLVSNSKQFVDYIVNVVPANSNK